MGPHVFAIAYALSQQPADADGVQGDVRSGIFAPATDVHVIGAWPGPLSNADWDALLQEGAPQGPAVADEPVANERSAANNPLEREMTPELDRAVTRGLARLAQMQNADGSWGEPNFGRSVAVTSLACLAFMADGNLPGRGVYGENVTKGLEYVLTTAGESGLFASDTANSPMYGHGFATLFVGEVYGMTQGGGDTDLSDRTHRALVRSVRLIESTQNKEGGWRYNPVPFDADTSVTIAQIMGLRSARNAGLEVSKDVIDRAVEYVRSCQNPDGGFRYQGQPGPSAWPRSAASVASLQYAGIYEDRAIKDGLEYIGRVTNPGMMDAQQIHYFYGHYYTVQACFLAGGDSWAAWWPRVRRELLASQQANGGWEDPSVGREYGTAMGLIVLQMPKRYLPIFQK
ncbi:MAG TPA: prenyltransferase/squalene oxidase repeat-containing protein [Phycisphaerales bacterium]|nr:prenyltransferase/squalene oxidase repeat-containing protein [Phycisphaerales bacterium]